MLNLHRRRSYTREYDATPTSASRCAWFVDYDQVGTKTKHGLNQRNRDNTSIDRQLE